MAGLNDFARRMSRIAVQVEGNVEQAVRDCSKAVARGAVEATPVDTGLARSNWVASLDAPAVGVVPAHVPGVGGSTGDANALAAIGLAESAIDGFEISKNREVHITNNAPHIGALNDGHSRQAPADFVRTAVMQGLATVRGAKILEE